jgi:hypothetical protein
MNIIIPLPLFIIVMTLALIGVIRAVYYAADTNITTLYGKICNTITGLCIPTVYVLTIICAVMMNI